jgi:glycosyltransferase involved in cell wall biosynthesis
MKGISVIICCYNSATRIVETLSYLAYQETNGDLEWEIVLVDNNSNDGTAESASTYWNTLNHPIALKVVYENQSGLIYAREKGATTAQYDYLLYCDDDNWLMPNYIQTLYNTIIKNNNIAMVGGWGVAVPETTPHAEFNDIKRYYAIEKPTPQSGKVDVLEHYVYGAGVGVQRKALLKLKEVGFRSLLIGPKGNYSVGGDDIELMLALALAGYDIYFNESLTFKHFIPSNRLSRTYQEKRIRDGIAFLVIRAYRDVIAESDKSYIRLCAFYALLAMRTFRTYRSSKKYNDYVVYQEYKSVLKASLFSPHYYFKAKRQAKYINKTINNS